MTDSFARRRMLSRLGRLWRFLVGLGVVCLLAFAGWVILASTWLGAREVKVVGVQHMSAAEVEQIAAVEWGTPLARLDVAGIEARLEDLPAVAVAQVQRSWPQAVTIRVTESTPVVALEDNGSYYALNVEGEVFRQLPGVPRRLPIVRADQLGNEGRAAALAQVAQVVGSLRPAIAATVDHVEVASFDSIVLALRNGDSVQWGSAESSERKAAVLAALLDIDAKVYDVRVPEQPTTRS